MVYDTCTFYMFREADRVKDEGNAAFKTGNYTEAISKYTDAIALCPLSARSKQAIYYRYFGIGSYNMQAWFLILEGGHPQLVTQ